MRASPAALAPSDAALVLGTLTLAACKEDPEEIGTVGAETSASPSDGRAADEPRTSTRRRRGRHRRRHRRRRPTTRTTRTGTPTTTTGDDGSEDEDPDSADDTSYAVDAAGPVRGAEPHRRAHHATESLPDKVVERIRAVTGVETALPFSLGSASIDGRTLTVAAVDPGDVPPVHPGRHRARRLRLGAGRRRRARRRHRRLDKRLVDKDDMLQLGSDEDAPEVHVGAIAPLIKRSPDALGAAGHPGRDEREARRAARASRSRTRSSSTPASSPRPRWRSSSRRSSATGRR